MEKQIEETELDLQSILFLLRIALKDKDENTRIAAVETLGAIGKPETVPILAIALENSSLQVRIRAISALFHFPERLRLPLLLRKLTDESPVVRAFAANSMWNIEDENTADTLFNLFLTEESFPVKLAFSAAIGKMGLSSSALQLMKLLDDENADISLKYMASLALHGIWEKMMKPRHIFAQPGSHIPPEIINTYQMLFRHVENWGGIPKNREDATSEYPAPFLFHLQESYGEYSPSFLMIQNPLGDFAKLAYLQRLVQDVDYQNFPYLYSCIDELQARDFTDIMIELLNDENYYNFYMAREAFKYLFISVWGTEYKRVLKEVSHTGDDRTKAFISEILKEKNPMDFSVDGESVHWEVSPSPIDNELNTKPENQDNEPHTKAVSLRKVLSNFRNYSKDDVVYLLISLFNDENYPARDEVVRILGEIDTELAREYVKKASVDKDPAVRRAAQPEIVKTFTDTESLKIYLTHSDRHLRRQAVEALGQLHDEECVPLLMEALEDEDPEVGIRAVNALASLGEVKAIEKMVEVLNRLESMETRLTTPLTLSFPRPEAIGYLLKSVKRCNSVALWYVMFALKALGRKIGGEPGWRQKSF